jgi:hypothetical protein
MALYFLTYDLRKSKDYQALYHNLHALGAVRIFESTWCFNKNDTTVTHIRDHFKQLLDADDGIAVFEVSTWAMSNTDGDPKEL